MSKTLQHILKQGENETTEFKTSFSDEAIISLVAFANTKGGAVYIGVKDDGNIQGVEIGKETIQKWANEIKSKTEPAIIPTIEVLQHSRKIIVAIHVQEFPVKPLSFKGRFYKRINNANHQLSISEISDVYLQSMQYSWDSYSYPQATIDDISLEKVSLFIAKVNDKDRFRLPIAPKEALLKLRMIKNDVPTNSAMILFSKENLLYNVHIGRFKTASFIIADKMINGNLFDVMEESMQTIIGHLKFAFEITGKTTQRTEIPEYPLEAIREALLNTLIHRDYQSPTDVQIKIFDNKITFFNPGGLYGNITEEELKTNTYQASTRNKQIAEAFYLTGDIEKYGSGFIRIRNAVKKYPTMQFSYKSTAQGFTSAFSYGQQKMTAQINEGTNVGANVGANVGVNVGANDVIKRIEKSPGLNVKEISRYFNVTNRTIERWLAQLKNEGKIEFKGATKTGGYYIVAPKDKSK